MNTVTTPIVATVSTIGMNVAEISDVLTGICATVTTVYTTYLWLKNKGKNKDDENTEK